MARYTRFLVGLLAILVAFVIVLLLNSPFRESGKPTITNSGLPPTLTPSFSSELSGTLTPLPSVTKPWQTATIEARWAQFDATVTAFHVTNAALVTNNYPYLLTAQKKWNSSHVVNYITVVRIDCLCPPHTTITMVRNGTTTVVVPNCIVCSRDK